MIIDSLNNYILLILILILKTVLNYMILISIKCILLKYVDIKYI